MQSSLTNDRRDHTYLIELVRGVIAGHVLTSQNKILNLVGLQAVSYTERKKYELYDLTVSLFNSHCKTI